MRNVGFVPVDPGTVKQGIESAIKLGKGLIEVAKNIFGGDKSPNYPIKSANTEKALRREVSENIPVPASVAHAKELIAKAETLKELNLKRDNSDKVIKTIRMMYDEAIAALNAFIQSGALPATGGLVFGDGSGTYTNTGNGKAIFMPGVTANTAPPSTSSGGSGGSGGSYLPNSGNSANSSNLKTKSGVPSWMMVLGAGAVLYLLTKKKR